MTASTALRGFDVCVVGSANLDLVVRSGRLPHPGETVIGHDYREYPGGKGLNQAIAAARAGARTAFVGAVGDDGAGAHLRDVLTHDGVDTSSLATSAEATGRALITVSDDGENVIVVAPGANREVTAASVPPCRVLLAQLEVPVATVGAAFAAARQLGALTILNPAPALEVPDEVLGLTDILVPNEGEAARMGGVERLLSRGVATIIVTRGADGVDLITSSGSRHVAAHRVTPVDTTGAGDTFCGYLAAGVGRGESLDEAIRRAVVAAAISTTRLGASTSIPMAAEVSAVEDVD
ncbi:MAG: ribokinase [Ilumatobacteraceae bacterium]